MKKPCTSQYRLILCNIAVLLAALLVISGAIANEHSPEAFDARYAVYRNNQHVADARFHLQHKNGAWLWKMQTRPRGLYRWLTRKKPFTETRMAMTPEGLKLSQLSHGDYEDKPPVRSSWFDHQRKTVFYTHSKKNQQRQLDLPESLYSFHSVHLLYRQMKQSDQQRRDIDFYYKGNLYTSTLTLDKDVPIPGGLETESADQMIQLLNGTDKKMIYYYQGHAIAPVRIERHKNGKLETMMSRKTLTN